MRTELFRPVDVPVEDGSLRVGVREDGLPDDAPAVLLVHGVTASHRAWDLVAERLPGWRVVAPDLRGRGRSNRLPAGDGMADHADDLVAVLDHLGIDRTLVVGHSMGGFVAVVLADRHPHRVSQVLLVDGGLPLDVPDGLSAEQVVQHVLGPAAERLAMEFGSVEDYLDFWRPHPAFATAWSRHVEEYFAYDLVGEPPHLRPATSYDAMARDTTDFHMGSALADALSRLQHPARLLTVPRGLFDEEPGLYAAARVPGLVARHPVISHRELPDLNHYTVVMSQRGADLVVDEVRRAAGEV